jgi:Uma2 family endonuclease
MEDYVAFAERMNDFGNFEWVNGEIIPVHGNEPVDDSLIDYVLSDDFDERQLTTTRFDIPTQKHDIIIADLIELLVLLGKTKVFRAYGQKTAVFIADTGNAREPDVVVVDKTQEQRNRQHQVLNPLLLVEVLSKSTAAKDKSDKLEEYQTLESLQDYVIIWQDTPKAVVYRKISPSKWEQEILIGPEAVLTLQSMAVSVPLKDLYAGVDFSETEQ